MAKLAMFLPSIMIIDVRKSQDNDIDPSDPHFEMRQRDPEQASLFPTEDLIVPDSMRSMRKSVSAIHAIPIKADHSQNLNSRRLFDACILLAQIDCKERGLIKKIREEDVSPLFEVRVTDLARVAGIPGKNYKRVYAELRKLYNMSLNWNVIGEDNKITWEMEAHFLSSIGFGKNEKRGLIRFSFDPRIIVIILEPSVWATLSLQAMSDLKTGASYALYQNTWRYINTDKKVTAPLPTATWIELLVGKSRYVVDDPKLGKRVQNYGDFKRRVLVDAIDRVNEVPALGYTLKLHEKKSGTRVARLQFEFIPKQQPSLGIPLTWSEEITQVLGSMGYSNSDIDDLSQAHSHEQVREAILRLKASETRLRGAGKPITSRRAYFEGILKNIAGGAVGEDLDHDRIEAEVKQREAQQAAEARQQRFKQEFDEHQKKMFSTWLFALPEQERDDLLTEAMSSQDLPPPMRIFFKKGLTPSNQGAQASFRSWISKNRPDLIDSIFTNPEDRTLDAWLAWKLDRQT